MGWELLVSCSVFFLDGLINKQTPEEQQRVDELFTQLSD
jgi:hypothetical protein